MIRKKNQVCSIWQTAVFQKPLQRGAAFHSVKFHYMGNGELEQSCPIRYSELNGLCKCHTCRNPAEIRKHRFLFPWFLPKWPLTALCLLCVLPGPGTGAEAEEI